MHGNDVERVRVYA